MDEKAERKYKKIYLYLGILFNIGILSTFKIYDFITAEIFYKSKIPIGISFFTLQEIAFLADVYRGTMKKCSFLEYILYVSFFPQLIAGPIVLTNEMFPQFRAMGNKRINWDNMCKGLYMFAIGLAKKTAIADVISIYPFIGFEMIRDYTFADAWFTAIVYSLQLYFDFSGYCDMAIGIALMFNIELPVNFDSPYKSTNVAEFWKRWNITLGRFMKNYLYVWLGGNRCGAMATYINIFCVFIISALWHGFWLNMLLWGAIHGVAVIVYKMWKRAGKSCNRCVAWAITTFFIVQSMALFKIKDMRILRAFFKGLYNVRTIPDGFSNVFIDKFHTFADLATGIITIEGIETIIAALIIVFFIKNSNEKLRSFNFRKINKIEIVCCLLIGILYLSGYNRFLYFNF